MHPPADNEVAHTTLSDSRPTPSSRGSSGAGRTLALTGLALIVLAAASLEGFVLPVLPQLQRDFGVDAATGALASVVPTVITVIVTPLAGRLADVYGANKTLAWLVGIVISGGLISAFGPTFPWFIAGQALQGFALGIIPVGFVALRRLFNAEQVKTASGVLVSMSIAGAGLGVLIAGPIIDSSSRAVLYAVPTGLVALGGAAYYAAERGSARAVRPAPHSVSGGAGPTRVDWLGAGVFAAALLVLVVALSSTSALGWASPVTLGYLVAASLLIALWVWIESRVAEPMVDVTTLRSRSVGGAVAVGIAIGAGYAPLVFLIPQLIGQPVESGYGLGATATETGYFLTAAYVAGVVASVLAGRLAARASAQILGAVAMLLLAAGALLGAVGASPGLVVGSLVLAGLGAAAASTVVYSAAAVGASEHEVGVSTALITIARAIGGAFATQIVASMLSGAAGIPEFSSFRAGFLVAAGLAVAGVIAAALLLPRGRGTA